MDGSMETLAVSAAYALIPGIQGRYGAVISTIGGKGKEIMELFTNSTVGMECRLRSERIQKITDGNNLFSLSYK